MLCILKAAAGLAWCVFARFQLDNIECYHVWTWGDIQNLWVYVERGTLQNFKFLLSLLSDLSTLKYEISTSMIWALFNNVIKYEEHGLGYVFVLSWGCFGFGLSFSPYTECLVDMSQTPKIHLSHLTHPWWWTLRHILVLYINRR